jgi:hypothetical protein
MWVRCETEDLSKFDPQSYFANHDFWKETTYKSEDVEYEDVEDKLDTTNNKNIMYEVELVRVKDSNIKLSDVCDDISDELKSDKSKVRYFFVANEKYSEEEILKLRPYCRCIACKSSYFSLNKYFACRCCVGCLHYSDERISDYVVKETRKYYNYKQSSLLSKMSSSLSSADDK